MIFRDAFSRRRETRLSRRRALRPVSELAPARRRFDEDNDRYDPRLLGFAVGVAIGAVGFALALLTLWVATLL